MDKKPSIKVIGQRSEFSKVSKCDQMDDMGCPKQQNWPTGVGSIGRKENR